MNVASLAGARIPHIAAPAGFVTWDPARTNPVTILSGGDLVAACALSPTQHAVTGADVVLSSGKWYWECTLTDTNSGVYPIVGVATLTSFSLPQPYNDILSVLTAYSLRSNGDLWRGSTLIPGFAPVSSSGDVISVAIDLDNQNIWFARNGVYPGSGDPGANVNPANITPVNVNQIPGANAGVNGVGIVTANFGQSTFAYPIPAGFARPHL